MRLLKNKYLVLVPILLVIMLTILFAYTLMRHAKTNGETKSSEVISTYSESATDGCDGFKLKNGDTVDTFCFWTKPEDQTDYEGGLKIGDKVEYGTQSNKQFIRLKR